MNENNLLAVNLFMHISYTLDVQYELESIRVTFQTILQPVEVAQLDGRYEVIINTICQLYLVTELHLKFPSRSETATQWACSTYENRTNKQRMVDWGH